MDAERDREKARLRGQQKARAERHIKGFRGGFDETRRAVQATHSQRFGQITMMLGDHD